MYSIPQNEQRYATQGDWFNVTDMTVVPPQEVLSIPVSKMDNEDYEFLIGLHELIEAWLCKKRGITAQMVDDWDMNSSLDEPGDSMEAPYYREHKFASAIEQLVAGEMGVNWDDYEAKLSEVLT
jgi:hypothetical protein